MATHIDGGAETTEDSSMGPALVLLGLVAAGAVITRLVGRASDKWFSDIDAMDQDYPSDRTDPTWGSGGGHIGM